MDQPYDELDGGTPDESPVCHTGSARKVYYFHALLNEQLFHNSSLEMVRMMRWSLLTVWVIDLGRGGHSRRLRRRVWLRRRLREVDGGRLRGLRHGWRFDGLRPTRVRC